MKKRYSLLAAITLAAVIPAAWAQQSFQYPSAPGSYSPPSTLRITETPNDVVPDTQESLDAYKLCRTTSDRAAVNEAEMKEGAAKCLAELEARRRAK